MSDEPFFHIALPEDWAAAFSAGEYRMSTRGVPLADDGFIHLSTRAQFVDTANRFYGDLDELVLLTIDPDRLTDPVRFEPPMPGADELFPHLYGPLPVSAVVTARHWRREDRWTDPLSPSTS